MPLDEVLAEVAPTTIKMDIEGAEPGALNGARGLIDRHFPRLRLHLLDQPILRRELAEGFLDHLRELSELDLFPKRLLARIESKSHSKDWVGPLLKFPAAALARIVADKKKSTNANGDDRSKPFTTLTFLSSRNWPTLNGVAFPIFPNRAFWNWHKEAISRKLSR